MENSKHYKKAQGYHQKINKLLQSLSFQKIKIFLTAEMDNEREVLLCFGGSFLQVSQKKVIIAKKKILSDIYDAYTTLKDQELKMIKLQIKGLLLSTQNIIRDQILNIYSEISELRQGNIQRRQMCQLLDKIQENLEPLLRDHFILKQLERMDTKYNSNSLKLILSQKKINISEDSAGSINSQESIKQFLSDKAFKRIQQQIHCKSIQKLITQQLQGQQKQINEGLETCRICKSSYKLKDIQRHVDYCSKVELYSSRRDQILIQQMEIIKQIQNQISQNNNLNQDETSNNQEYFLELNKIHQLIVEIFQRKPNILRRTSACHQKQRKLSKKLSQQIEKYLKVHKNQSIQLFRSLTRQKELIEKKITSLQNNFLYFRDQSSNSQNTQGLLSYSNKKITRSFKTAKLMKINTRKSIFARKSENSSTYSEHFSDQIHKIKQFQPNYTEESVDDEHHGSQKQILCKSLSHFNFKDEKRNEISIDDFQILSFLGQGAFGKVYLVRRKQTKDIYALKVIKILENWKEKQLNSIKNEHDILSKIAGQHLVKAPFSFTEGLAHFFVFQYMPGGDLAKLIEQQTYFDLKQSQFYIAQIVLAIEHLHNMGIIHRDLKPENLIFDQNCHLKLTDFGLSEFRINDKIKRARKCKQNVQQQQIEKKNQQVQNKVKLKSQLIEGKTKIRIVGTPDYIAPEVITGQSLDNLSIDWWSLGVIAYELMIGCRPFCANTIQQVFKNIQQLNIQWPEIGEQESMISQVSVDFIKKLLNKNFNERLGAKSISQIKQHQFFRGVNWQEIKQQKPPLHPNLHPKQKFMYSQQVPELRAEILNAIGKNTKTKSTFKLQNFVRYDILVEETLQSADKQIVKRSARINRLKSIASNFSNENICNKQEMNLSEGLSDDDAQKSWRTIQKIN